MKKHLFLFVAIIMIVTTICKAQVPQAFSYQAVIRNSSNALVTNQAVSERISLLKDSANGTVVYSETQNAKTNANGLVSLQIGTGNVLNGTFNGINWATGTYFIKIETDPKGGKNYTLNNTTQLLSVPYALQAGNAPSLEYPDGVQNITPIIINLDSISKNFTVPQGKNLYLYNNESTPTIDSLYNLTSSTTTQSSNLLIGEGHVVNFGLNNGYLNRTSYFGFLADKIVDPVFADLTKGAFIVPKGKYLVIINIMYSPYSYGNQDLLINGTITGLYAIYSKPIIIPSGSIISSTQYVIDGYLR